MQSITGSVSSRHAFDVHGLLLWMGQHLRGLALAERPAIRWTDMRPVDFEGEDTSLTQEHLVALK